MASANGDEEYETDPDEAKLSLALRRRVASDDEDGEDVDVRVSDDELDDQEGVPEDYHEEEEEALADRLGADVETVNEFGRVMSETEAADGLENQVEEEKVQEPFAVPTAGAFYMHDDRFRDNAAAPHRRTPEARKIWESRDERRWGHDKFEELTSQGGNNSESRRNSKEHHRGRGRNRGAGRGYSRGNRSKVPEDKDNQAPVPTVVTVRGPRRYVPASHKRRSEVPQTQYKQPGKNLEKAARSYSNKGSVPSSSVAYEAVPARKNMVASNLSSASPPFYPSGASGNDLNVKPKIDMQSSDTDRFPQPSSMFRENGMGDSLGLNKLHLEDTNRKVSSSSNVHPSRSTPTSKGPQVRAPGRGQGYARHMPSPSASHLDHASKVSGVQFSPSQQGPPVKNQTRAYSPVNGYHTVSVEAHW